MPTVTSTILDGRGNPLQTLMRFRRESSGYDEEGQVLSRAVVMKQTTAAGALSVVLTPGVWLFTYPCGAQLTRGMIDVPTAAGTYDLDAIRVDAGTSGRVGTIYYGTSEEETLDQAGIEALASNITKGRIAGQYEFAAGGYKFFAWPDWMVPPAPTTGIKVVTTGLPLVMAGDEEGYTAAQNGWHHQLVAVGSGTYRVFRSRQQLGAEQSILLT